MQARAINKGQVCADSAHVEGREGGRKGDPAMRLHLLQLGGQLTRRCWVEATLSRDCLGPVAWGSPLPSPPWATFGQPPTEPRAGRADPRGGLELSLDVGTSQSPNLVQSLVPGALRVCPHAH